MFYLCYLFMLYSSFFDDVNINEREMIIIK